MIEIVNLSADMAEELERIELTSFPLANPEHLLSADDIRMYAEVFPEGYFVALDHGRPVGMGAGILLDFDFENYQHNIIEITGEGGCGNHDPSGLWYYGTDLSVLPEYRGRGIGKLLYRHRKQFVIDQARAGIVAGGSLPGFFDHKARIPVDEYVDLVVRGELSDPTLSFQLANGFEVRGLLENYLEDEVDDGWAALIVWENPYFSESLKR